MAIAGSGGWTPAIRCGFNQRQGKFYGIAPSHNVPPETVVADITEACDRIWNGELIYIPLQDYRLIRATLEHDWLMGLRVERLHLALDVGMVALAYGALILLALRML